MLAIRRDPGLIDDERERAPPHRAPQFPLGERVSAGYRKMPPTSDCDESRPRAIDVTRVLALTVPPPSPFLECAAGLYAGGPLSNGSRSA